MWRAMGGTDHSGISAPALCLYPWLWTAWYTPASGHQSKQPFSLCHTPLRREMEGASPPHENNLLPNPNETLIHVWVHRTRQWAQGWVLHPKRALLRVKPLHLEAHQKPNSLLLIVRINMSSNIHCTSKSMWTPSSIIHDVLTCTKPKRESYWFTFGSQTQSCNIKVQPHCCACVRMGAILASLFQHLVKKPFQKSARRIREYQLAINDRGFNIINVDQILINCKYNVGVVFRCPHTFGHIHVSCNTELNVLIYFSIENCSWHSSK